MTMNVPLSVNSAYYVLVMGFCQVQDLTCNYEFYTNPMTENVWAICKGLEKEGYLRALKRCFAHAFSEVYEFI